MDNELVVIIKDQNVATENAKALIAAFGAPFTEAGEILRTYEEIVVTDESQTDLMKKAKEKRLALKRIRVGVENKRKELKEESLRTGKAIDGVARYIRENIEPAEKYLELQEKFAEIKRAEEAARVKQERTEKLSQYVDDISIYNLDTMNQDAFTALIAKLRQERDDKITAEKAEAERVEQERIAREAEQQRIREENERLRNEAEERERVIAEERRAEQARLDKIEAEHQKQLADERAKLAAIEAEKRAVEEAERRAQAAAEERERQALLAPDKQKIEQFADALAIVRTAKLPAVKSNEAQQIVNFIENSIVELEDAVKQKAAQL